MGSTCTCVKQKHITLPATFAPGDEIPLLKGKSTLVEQNLPRKKSLTDLVNIYDKSGGQMSRKLDMLYRMAIEGESGTIYTIDLRCNRLGLTGAQHLCELLPFYDHITQLKLWKCNLSKPGLSCFLKGIKVLKNLESLTLDDMDLDDKHASLLGRNFPYTSKLKRIHLAANDLTEDGVETLSTYLEMLPLEELNLDHNLLKTLGCLAIIQIAVKIGSVQQLSLACNGIDDDALEALDLLSHSLKHITITLSDNCFSSEGIRALTTIFGDRLKLHSQK